MSATLDESLPPAPLVDTAGELDELVELEALEALRDRLLVQLREQREAALAYYAWYRCEQDPPALPRGYSPAFERLRKMSRGSFARLVVDAIVDRLEINGVRSTVGQDADDAAWSLLQQNRIDADQAGVHAESLITGVSYVSVAGAGDAVRITPETCLEVTHTSAPGDRRSVVAALKLLELGAREWLCELYLPERTLSWVAEYATSRAAGPLAARSPASVPWGEPLELGNDLGAVPVVPFENRPTAATVGESELAELVPIMERIAELELAKLVAAHTAVFRQKWATGLDVPRDPETGEPIEKYTAAVARLWVSDDPETRFGTFEATEITQYTRAIGDEVAELAAVSRVPAYYLVQTELANPPSAESLIASETGLVSRCNAATSSFGEGWENVVRLAGAAGALDELAADRSLEVLWAPVERRNPAAVADAAVKLQAIGVPTEYLWAFVGYSPQAIERMRQQAAAAELAALAAAELAGTTTTPPA